MFILIVEGLIINKLVIVLFNYNVSLYELPSENKVFIIIIIIFIIDISGFNLLPYSRFTMKHMTTTQAYTYIDWYPL